MIQSKNNLGTSSTHWPTLGSVLLVCAIAIPVLSRFGTPVSPIFYNQLLTLSLWGFALLALSSNTDNFKGILIWKQVFLGVFLILTLWIAILLAAIFIAEFNDRVLSSLGTLPAVIIIIYAGAKWRISGQLESLCKFLATGILIGALINSFVACAQIINPELTSSFFIASLPPGSRAGGNLRQPNHLALWLLWGLVALSIFLELKKIRLFFGLIAASIICLGLVFSASKTGYLGLVIIFTWAFFDKKLNPDCRKLLIASPFIFFISWLFLDFFETFSGGYLTTDLRLNEFASSTSRLVVWKNTVQLISHNAWTGIGWGEFNFAWTLTSFKVRTGEFFDNTHNIFLQVAVELGLATAGLLTFILLKIFLHLRNSITNCQKSESTLLKNLMIMVLIIGMHSCIEYPLWYVYFLFPTALIIGAILPINKTDVFEKNERESKMAFIDIFLFIGGLGILFGSLFFYLDYKNALQVTHPANFDNPPSLRDRVSIGRQSLFFPAEAERALVFRSLPSSTSLQAATKAAHTLADTHLLMSWVKSLHEVGDYQRAKYISDRIKEFNQKEITNTLIEWEINNACPEYISAIPPDSMSYKSFR